MPAPPITAEHLGRECSWKQLPFLLAQVSYAVPRGAPRTTTDDGHFPPRSRLFATFLKTTPEEVRSAGVGSASAVMAVSENQQREMSVIDEVAETCPTKTLVQARMHAAVTTWHTDSQFACHPKGDLVMSAALI